MTPPLWSDSQDARRLLVRQRISWSAAKSGYEALEKVAVKVLLVGDFTVKVQYNPARIVSSGAKTDAQSVRDRRCFLCPPNLAPEQEALPMGEDYLLLCNPFPIFAEHFTIASRHHVEQRIYARFADLLKASRQLSDFTLFYNGPQCGASAPDHLHFQAVTGSYMPIDNEIPLFKGEPFIENVHGKISLLTGYMRNGFIIESATEEGCCFLFTHIYNVLPIPEGDAEPRMNLFCRYTQAGGWIVALISRTAHRPRQYCTQGSGHILTAPGAADIGGVFITALEEDFEKITPALLCDIYSQIAFSDSDIRLLAERACESPLSGRF
ncbi:MAG: DUF4922 domain-containing protein [Tannerellaceae bacterium]|jgi:hypothetical protein|nr:DUF4922 domain-containing protein [Tannerellaceae bacterium]